MAGGRYWPTEYADREITRALQIELSHGSSSSSTFPPTPPTPTTFTVSASADSNTNSSSTFAKPATSAGRLRGRKTCKRKSRVSKRSASSSTRYIVTDLSNFREKVQQFTGVDGDAMGFTEHEPPEKLVRKRVTVPESYLPTLDTSANLFHCGTKEDRSTFPPPATSSYFPTDQSWRDLLETTISGSMPSLFLPSPTCGGGGELPFVSPMLETAIAGSLSSFPPPSPPLFPFPTLDSWGGVI